VSCINYTMGNESTPIDVSYYPLTVQASGTNDNIIIGLLVGLLVGVTTLVLLTGAILVSVILKNAKRQNDTNACNVEKTRLLRKAVVIPIIPSIHLREKRKMYRIQRQFSGCPTTYTHYKYKD
jgi:hypothetical protein